MESKNKPLVVNFTIRIGKSNFGNKISILISKQPENFREFRVFLKIFSDFRMKEHMKKILLILFEYKCIFMIFPTFSEFFVQDSSFKSASDKNKTIGFYHCFSTKFIVL